MAMGETDLQQAIIRWAETKVIDYPELAWLHAVPNGGNRDGREAMKLKLEGVKAGIADLALDVARFNPDTGQFYFGLKLELKRPLSKEKPSTKQIEYMDFCTGNGYWSGWTNDFNVAKSNIMDYLQLPRLPHDLLVGIPATLRNAILKGTHGNRSA